MTPDRHSTLCALPWIHLSTTVDGVWGRCCFDASNDYEHLYREPKEPTFTLRDDAIGCLPHSRYARDNPDRVVGIREAFNSSEMRKTRRDMLAGRRPDACRLCYAREDAGATSHRQAMNGTHGRVLADEHLLERTAPDGTLHAEPVYLDLRLGNSCNLGCIMCSFPVSSRLGVGARPAWTAARIDPYADDDEFWADLSDLVPSLREIYFAGGEPFLSPLQARILDLLIDQGVNHRVHLHYNSNLTVLPARLLDRLQRFPHAEVAASCDGVGEVFERIRVGARWEHFVRNLRRARRHLNVWLDVTVQRDNIAHLGDLTAFAAAEGLKIRLENILDFPRELSIRNLPAHEKARCTSRLEALAQDDATTRLPEVSEQLRRIVTYISLPADLGP